MKIKIDKYGLLWIEKLGRLREQVCPYRGNGWGCGDWCPHFFVKYSGETHNCKRNVKLRLCNAAQYTVHSFVDEFIDERTHQSEEEGK